MVSSIIQISILAAFCAAANAIAIVPRQAIPSADQIAGLAPDLGAVPNTNPNPFGDCDGPIQANNQRPRVPCQCPPTKDAYIAALTADVQAGHAVNNPSVQVTFPVGNSVQDKHGRITAAIIALQNLNGPGKGCPGVSTTLGIQSNNLDKCGDFFCDNNNDGSSNSTSAAATSTSTATANTQAVSAPPQNSVAPVPTANTSGAVGNDQITRDLVDQLAPQLGSQPNNRPTGSGDCKGPGANSDKNVPCACPPVRPEFIDALFADIQAGHAVHNPSVAVTFPTGNSKADQHARITAASITLQNLNGPGQGCPFVSTTFGAQSDAIGN